MRLTYPQIDAVYKHLRELKCSFGLKCDRRERAVVIIAACISNGFDTRSQIIKGISALGLSKDHVLGLLDEQTGTVPGLHLWSREPEGHYRLLGET